MQKTHEPKKSELEPLRKPNLSIADDSDTLIRRFIRHPSSVPIEFDVIECGRGSGSTELKNVSRGGLCFFSDVPLPKGARVHLEIPIDVPPFEVNGEVAWCRVDECNFLIGVEFEDGSSAFSVRMVEQVCYIEHYRSWVQQAEGRSLSSEQAAKEWVELYAEDFPRH